MRVRMRWGFWAVAVVAFIAFGVVDATNVSAMKGGKAPAKKAKDRGSTVSIDIWLKEKATIYRPAGWGVQNTKNWTSGWNEVGDVVVKMIQMEGGEEEDEPLPLFAGAAVYPDYRPDDAKDLKKEMIAGWRTEVAEWADPGKPKIQEGTCKLKRKNGKSYTAQTYTCVEESRVSYMLIAVGEKTIFGKGNRYSGLEVTPVYYLSFSCSVDCWKHKKAVLDKVVGSFTVP